MTGRLGKVAAGCLLAAVVLISLVGTPEWLSVPVSTEAGYEYHDEWKDYLAPKARCPGGEDPDAPATEQMATMLCLINWARTHHGVAQLARSPLLMRSAELKTASLVRCDEFTHTPCGQDAGLEATSLGYLRNGGSFGENLAFGGGGGEAGAARPTLDGWLASPGHRQNMLRPGWREHGVAVRQASDYAGLGDGLVWVSHFGVRSPPAR